MFTTINTHEFVKEFIKASKSKSNSAEKQAEVIADTISTIQEGNFKNLATKNDIKLVRQEIKIAMLTTIISMGVMISTAIGIIAWLDKIIN